MAKKQVTLMSGAPESENALSKERPCVLVVDDHALNIALVKQFLGDDYQVVPALSGAVALELCRSQKHMHDLHDEFMNDGGELAGSWTAVRKDGSSIQVTSESIRVPGNGDQYNRLVYVVNSNDS